MGTILEISSHSSSTAEAAYDVRLLLLWPAAFPDTRSWFAAPGFPVMLFTAYPSCCPFFPPKRDFRDEVSLRRWYRFPKVLNQFREIETEVFFSWSPVTQSLKERFRFSPICWTSWTGVHSFRLRLSWCAVPKVWMNRIVFHLRNLFRSHINWAAFYRSPDRPNVI